MNEKLAAIHYSGEGAVIERDFPKEMIGIAKGVDFSQREWYAALNALMHIKRVDVLLDNGCIDRDELVSNWMAEVLMFEYEDDLHHHFSNGQGEVDGDAVCGFFNKIEGMPKEKAMSILYVAYNFWVLGEAFRPMLEELGIWRQEWEGLEPVIL